jgi:8-oxo-dGTP diphosphatase
MTDSAKARAPTLAAGGIVLRQGTKPRIAIVRLRKDKSWALPKGKLGRGEDALTAARREVLEETGYRVSIHQFLGAMSYAADGKIKIVQFWHMWAVGEPVRELMADVKAVKWVSLKEAIDMLTRIDEKVFLANVGPIAIKAARTAGARRMRFAKEAKPEAQNRRLATRSRLQGAKRQRKPISAIRHRMSRMSHPSARAN